MASFPPPTQDRLDRVQARQHPLCVLCGRENCSGLRLRFSLLDDGSVETTFQCEEAFQGYSGMLSGGIVASLLDSAMTNCLFARGIAAVTAELSIRFLRPVPLGLPITVQARLEQSRGAFHRVAARLLRHGETVCRAQGKFIANGGRVDR